MDIPFYRHFIWSDGCAGQFKNARVFEWLCLLHIKYKVHMYGTTLKLAMEKEFQLVKAEH